MVGRRVKRAPASKAKSKMNEQVKASDEIPNVVLKQETVSSPHEDRELKDEENSLNSSMADVPNNNSNNCSDVKEEEETNQRDPEPKTSDSEKTDVGDGKEMGDLKSRRKLSSSSDGSSSRSRSPSPEKTHRNKRHASTSSSSSSDEKNSVSPLRSNTKRASLKTTDRDGGDAVDLKDLETSSDKTKFNETMEKHPEGQINDDQSMEASESFSKEVESKQSVEKEDKPSSKKIYTRKLSLSGSKESEKDDSAENKVPRKRKWGALNKAVPKGTPSISTESLKDLIPDYKPSASTTTLVVDNPHSEVLAVDDDPLVEEKTHTHVRAASPKPSPKLQSSNIMHGPEVDKHRAPVREEILPPSPPKNPASCIVHIRNLVRPFTLHQLKEELGKTGTLVDDSFWIDKIKSKCYVTYETEEQAAATRQALHGARWPVSNPKTLAVDFSTKEELDFHKDLGDAPPPPPVPKQEMNFVEVQRDVRHPTQEAPPAPEPRRPSEKEERGRKREREREKERIRRMPIREWDRDKLNQDMPPVDDARGRGDRVRERDGPRAPRERRERTEKKESKKKHEVETPAKLLDDLFRKTKTTPCIYWLPLTEEQREEAKKHREEEREKRRQRISLEEKEIPDVDRRQRVRERDNRPPIRDRDASRRSRSRSRSPGRRR